MTDDQGGIPGFDRNGNLPPGVYQVSLREIEGRFTWNSKRKELFDGLQSAVDNLAAAGVEKIWVDGSFVTHKAEPNDIDGCWEPNQAIDEDTLDPVFLVTMAPRLAMKRKYGVDFMIAGTRLFDAGGERVEDFFQEDKEGNPKGILLLEIEQKP